jgi:hypothetical protein
MKTVAIAHFILLTVIASVIINSELCKTLVEETIREIESTDTETASKESYEKIFDKYMRRQQYIGLTVSHDDLTNIEDCFRELIGSAEVDDNDNITITKSRLTGALRHLRRLCGINFDSIL